MEDYDKRLEACYIYSQHTYNELFGIISCEDFFSDFLEENQLNESITKDTYSSNETLYKLYVENKRPLGTSLTDFISLDENELSEFFKETYGDTVNFKLLENTPLFPYAILRKSSGEQDELTKIFDTISSIRGYIDLCNVNEAFFVKQWFEVFLNAEKIDRTNPELYTEVECVTEDKLYNSEMEFVAVQPRDMFKFNRFLDHMSENEKNSNTPLILSPEQKKVSKTMLVVEIYKNPAACFYRSLEVLVENKLMPKQCKNCGKYFVPDKRSDTMYCSRQAPQNSKKTCKKYGSDQAWKKNKESDEAVELYRKFYQRKQTKANRNPSEESLLDFENYKTVSKQWRADVRAGIRAEADFIDWLKSL